MIELVIHIIQQTLTVMPVSNTLATQICQSYALNCTNA